MNDKKIYYATWELVLKPPDLYIIPVMEMTNKNQVYIPF